MAEIEGIDHTTRIDWRDSYVLGSCSCGWKHVADDRDEALHECREHFNSLWMTAVQGDLASSASTSTPSNPAARSTVPDGSQAPTREEKA